MKWSDIDWETGRITIHSPKTEHLVGGESRTIPLWPELRSLLAEALNVAPDYDPQKARDRIRDPADPGCEKESSDAFRTHYQEGRLRSMAKTVPNLRSYRQTELANTFPLHVVCAWIGNSEAVARDHYLQVTDAHFKKALESALQNPVQNVAESQRHLAESVALKTEEEFANDREIVPFSLQNTVLGKTTYHTSQCAREDSNLRPAV